MTLNTMKKKDEIEIIYENYKEPLRKVKGGYGYYGTIGREKATGKIQCNFCGDVFDTLSGKHIKNCTKGKISSQTEYKEALGINRRTPLISTEVKEKMQKAYMNNEKAYKDYVPYIDETSPDYERVMKRRRQIRELINSNRGKKRKQRLEYQNKRGTCPDQLIDKIKEAVKINGGLIPTKREFIKIFKGAYITGIYNTFGTYTEGLRRAGFTPNISKKQQRYEDDELLAKLQWFYNEKGRVPTWADMNGDELPTGNTYINRWGTVNNARAKAGIPQLIQLNNHRVVEYK